MERDDWRSFIHPDAITSTRWRLLVPMAAEALVVGAAGSPVMDLTPLYRNLFDEDEAALGVAMRPPLGDGKRKRLTKGIHLHWTLPAAFTHLRAVPQDAQMGEGDADLRQPPVPNRWLVTRLIADAGNGLATKSWLIESDAVQARESSGGAPWLISANGTLKRCWIGRSRVFGEGADTAGEKAPNFTLTAFGPANLGFAAFYPSCRNVFGFHDTAEGLGPGASCTYLLTGWFSDPAADPLAGAVDRANWLRVMDEQGWSIHGAGEARHLPTTLTCHAALSGVVWIPDAPPRLPFNSTIDVALGRGLMEAAAVLALDRTHHPRQLADTAQFAALAERRPIAADFRNHRFLDGVGLLLEQQARLHQSEFSVYPGGSQWELARRPRRGARPETQPEPLVTVSRALSDLLTALNMRQQALDLNQRHASAARREVFDLWCQRQYQNAVARQEEDASRARIRLALDQRVADATHDLSTLNDELGTAASLCEAAKAQLAQALADAALDCDVVERPAARFWRAADPFVLLKGIPAPVMLGAAHSLPCRLDSQVAARLVSGIGKAPHILATRAMLESDPAIKATRDALPPDTGARTLMHDLLMMDPNLRSVLARCACQAEAPNPGPEQIALRAAEIGRAVAALLAAAAEPNFNGAAAALKLTAGDSTKPLLSLLSAFHAWQPDTPAQPVFLVWKARWTRTPLPDDGVRRYDLEADGIDCRRPAEVAPGHDEGALYEGVCLATTNLERTFPLTPQPFLERSALAPLMGQSLSGLTEALGMRDAGAQLPPLILRGGLERVDEIAALVIQEYSVGPLLSHSRGEAGAFEPSRNGFLQLEQLSVVDTFGRVLTVIARGELTDRQSRLQLGRTLRAASQPMTGATAAWLGGRLTQPARLRVRWLDAERDEREVFATDVHAHPICGWVIHNRLARSLLVYDRTGALLGSVEAAINPSGQEMVRWNTVLRRQAAGNAPDAQLGEISNPHLHAFVEGLVALTQQTASAAFKSFRDHLDRFEDEAPPAADRGWLSALSGQPLALVRAALLLELDGPPWHDQSLENLIGDGPPPTGPSIRIQARVGDRRLGPDGLVGTFVDPPHGRGYRALRARADVELPARPSAEDYLDPACAIDLQLDAGREQSDEVRITLLMDPKRSTHLVCGILPAMEVRLAPTLVSHLMADFEVPFLTAPVLGERFPGGKAKLALDIPLPTDTHGDWSFISFPEAQADAEETPLSQGLKSAASLSGPISLFEGWMKYRPKRQPPTTGGKP